MPSSSKFTSSVLYVNKLVYIPVPWILFVKIRFMGKNQLYGKKVKSIASVGKQL